MTFLEGVTYESWTAITQSIPFILAILVVWLFPIILYLIIAVTTHAKTSSGKKLNSLMIESSNALIPFLIWGLIQTIFILTLIIFPFWLKLI